MWHIVNYDSYKNYNYSKYYNGITSLIINIIVSYDSKFIKITIN